MVQYGIRQMADVMQQMTSVERIVQYTDVEREDSSPIHPPANWPSSGHIEFKNVSLWYDKTKPVLKNLNIDIHPGWKVGIVGRTGSGKTSLISALFRLFQIDGKIQIDGIDTKTISLDSLRTNISIIPQDPVLFSETIRYNLDPFNLYSDSAIWNALKEVKLPVERLDHMVTEGGANFSVGERQLICLARAILRNNKILVLDEATANVDIQTDILIQNTIRNFGKSKNSTVLVVAHRLHTVMDSDRILVMDAGSIREFDYPYRLLGVEGGALREMVDATGFDESRVLNKIAEEKFHELNVGVETESIANR